MVTPFDFINDEALFASQHPTDHGSSYSETNHLED